VQALKVPDMKVTSCPFCGVSADVPHETQERCIAALHSEIARMREVVARVKEASGRQPELSQDTPEPSDGR
jgi:hypothetical protein